MISIDQIFSYSAKNPLLFNQYTFLLLFTAMFAGFTLIHKQVRVRNFYLLAFSLFFYFKCSGLYFLLLLFSTLVDYGCGFGIYLAKEKWEKKFYLGISLFANLGLLGFFKYSYFLTEAINGFFQTDFKAVNFLSAFANGTFGVSFDIYEILLPVGISFYTFQTLSYSIDIYRGKLKPCGNIFDFAFFVSFFPQLVAGPIVRAAEFLPQIKRPYYLSSSGFGRAVFLIMAGLFKKVVISDYISVNFVDRVFETPEIYSGFMNLMAVYGYSIQIYCDFSGYSDIAIGLAALLGFKLPINFNSPYKSQSLTEFWRRWHISLSSWLRDYLYISLGGNRKSKVRTYVNLFITMLLGGLWHGAATKFIVWGALHGAGLAVHRVWAKYFNIATTKVGKVISVLITFHFVAFCWMYFRATDMATVGLMLENIFTNFDFDGMLSRMAAYRKVFVIMLLGYVAHMLPSNLKNRLQWWFTESPMYVKALIFVIVVVVIYQATSADIQPFIYFQF
ncbi:MAG: D-alanyl-lipoteichoic acid acyltransferase DltB (MBOAT superfamily) [Bacteroidia bacterium]|jgi:D-alanyl-lipoteichoic acid acyltransferase DltB (MBOAT superfamily)|tara:strand:+ start:864 stop:2372 length:1509 start_codon:yes stop_codon:yes gene_type:complete